MPAVDWSLFDRIYVINLPFRLDRRREIEQQLAAVGLTFQSPQVRLFEAVRPPDAAGFPTVGTHGCFLSHLGVLRDAAGLSRIAIFEDDLNFSRDFLERAPAMFQDLASNPEWRFFYGANSAKLPQGRGLLPLRPDLPLTGAHFLGIQGDTAPIADFLTAMLNRPPGHPEGGPMHVDGAYSWYRAAHQDQPALYACPDLGYQRPSRTDIHALAWYDNVNGVRDVAFALRRFKSTLRELGLIGQPNSGRAADHVARATASSGGQRSADRPR
jgi:glycosyl transferase, family 25